MSPRSVAAVEPVRVRTPLQAPTGRSRSPAVHSSAVQPLEIVTHELPEPQMEAWRKAMIGDYRRYLEWARLTDEQDQALRLLISDAQANYNAAWEEHYPRKGAESAPIYPDGGAPVRPNEPPPMTRAELRLSAELVEKAGTFLDARQVQGLYGITGTFFAPRMRLFQ